MSLPKELGRRWRGLSRGERKRQEDRPTCQRVLTVDEMRRVEARDRIPGFTLNVGRVRELYK